ncbi:glycolipid transfer protein [Dendrothele bispora CBS 962.96]|uniref:Glycolipid transfer protein n=1 Tax=Dendrothele bispora (strain CBS 962.96) TaxID=1314807 RepID=A0A4S8LKL8_DENBC|nr:glycolipid transfer protein [Dendrothele bispora CBS 962.96]
MPPYFETIKSFADVPITSDGIDTKSFLEALDGLVMMFDLFASRAFSYLQADIIKNIDVVRNWYQSHESSSRKLETLVEDEVSSDPTSIKRKDSARACLVRLIRGLSLLCKALQHMQEDKSAELRVCFRKSYDSVMKDHHSFITRSLVHIALFAMPRRQYFYEVIAQGSSEEKIDTEMAHWVDGASIIVERMTKFLADGGFGEV